MKFKQFLEQYNKDITVYFDLDQTLADFAKKFLEHNDGISKEKLVSQTIPDDEFWPMVLKIDSFWETLETIPNGLKLLKYVSDNGYNVEILSSPSRHDTRSVKGKHTWIKNTLSKYNITNVNLVKSDLKKNYADSKSILIDDLKKNVVEFRKAGGKAILFKDTTDHLSELKKLLSSITLTETFDRSNSELLTEKQIVINNDAKYGQVLFLSGGAGSGKGWAISNYINSNLYKVSDVDEMKKAFLKLSELKNKYPEIRGLNLKNPKDVTDLHMFVKKKGIKERSLDLLLKDKDKGRLPNIIFDVTGKDVSDFTDTIPLLLESGYLSSNIHLAWVLTNYSIAVKQNAQRERVVLDDIMLKTHSGAAKTMWKFINSKKLPKGMDGSMYVILNNKENTIFYSDSNGNIIKNSHGNPIIKDFKYMTIKSPNGPISSESKIESELYNWIVNNVPKSKLTQDIFPSTN